MSSEFVASWYDAGTPSCSTRLQNRFSKLSIKNQSLKHSHILTHPGKPYWIGSISTVDLLVLTSLDQLLFKLTLNFLFYKATFLNEEVNCTEPSPSVRVPWPSPCAWSSPPALFFPLLGILENPLISENPKSLCSVPVLHVYSSSFINLTIDIWQYINCSLVRPASPVLVK